KIENRQLKQENVLLKRTLGLAHQFSNIIGRSESMLGVFKMIETVARTNSTILLTGESGTGKGLVAQAIHFHSLRREKPFVALNCGALPENLLESELFGHMRGAFTGADANKKGLLEVAERGTVFLDEIGEMSPVMQVKLLRVLQERRFRRVGGLEELQADIRVIAATNQDLAKAIADGRFREDLYYRIAEIVVEIPPLRARKGDAALLAHSFVHKFAAEQRRGAMTLLPDAVAAIEAHTWPGNVRELENVIKRAVIMADALTIGATDVGLEPADAEPPILNLRRVREEAEKDAVLRVLGRVNGNYSKAAELLGVSRPTLYDLMHRCGLK
ncbi:MAG TPA: sigma 54-interacting transcriptional regulator, partial [Casimicrobiaceae bacterium]|nr:sigma 54-interacting transcriptional regulator [Casimicrobiaceae bacterium]